MASPKTRIRNSFPKLAPAQFDVTSDRDPRYNCIAWAANDTKNFWSPIGKYHWPPGAPRELTVECVIQTFAALGYETCDSFQFEDGYEKVAIFANKDGVPLHMARQLQNGSWTSKLGSEWDIEHRSVVALESPAYGQVKQALRRKVNPPPEPAA